MSGGSEPDSFNQKLHFIECFLLSNHIPHTTSAISMPYISARFHPGSDQLKRLASPVERSRPEGRIEWSDPTIRGDSDGQPWWDECPVKWYDNWLPHVKWFQNSSECGTKFGPVQWTIGIRNWTFPWSFLQSYPHISKSFVLEYWWLQSCPCRTKIEVIKRWV